MPAAAVYVVAIIGAVAAGVAFTEFVYKPHLAPVVDGWVEEIKANREARRRLRQRRAASVSILEDRYMDDVPTPRSGSTTAAASGVDGNDARWRQSVVELQDLAERERSEWRDSEHDGLRRRHAPVNESVAPLSLESLAKSTQRWDNHRAPDLEMRSPSDSSLTMPTPRVSSPTASDRHSSVTLFSASRASSPDVAFPTPTNLATPPRSPPVVHNSPRSPSTDPEADLSLSDWTPTSPGRSEVSAGIGGNLTDSFAEIDPITPVAPQRSETASPFVLSSSRRMSDPGSADEPELVTYAHTDVSLDSDDDLSDIGSADGSDVSGWASVGRSPQMH